METIANRNVEVVVLGILALMLAATLQPWLVWLGVVVAYVAFLKSCNVPMFTAAQRRGYTLITCNVASNLSICFVLRQTVAPRYNVWQLGYSA